MYSNYPTRTSVILLLVGFLTTTTAQGQQAEIPESYSNLGYDSEGKLYFEKEGFRYYEQDRDPTYTIDQLLGRAEGTQNGIMMDFGDFEGTITYGLIPYDQSPHPLPVFRFNRPLKDGKVEVDIARAFDYPYDFVGWSEKGRATLGYRLADRNGELIFDGEISVTGTGPFKVAPTLYEGPFVNKVKEDRAVIWFNTTAPTEASVEVDGRTFKSEKKRHHEIEITGLEANREYAYTVTYGTFNQSYHFKTAPEKGSREPFIFAYTSDSRHATGGGERKIYGANAYIMKKMGALAYDKGAAFVQFTGDMINGYRTNKEDMHVEYTNWKKSIEPFWHYMPFNIGVGNHEMLGFRFVDEKGARKAFVDGFPYEIRSGEAAFQEAFVNPVNGPDSEDGSRYDPDPDHTDFPSYDESVFYYTYGNLAMIVLNSDYWFAPTISRETTTGGGLHGYIMDNQLQWLEQTVKKLENDSDIDHIFVTQHTPVFPNGGHSGDDMWYSGNNEKRSYVAGKPVEQGIIERRDEYLDILINESTKVVGVLTGDEHNYNWLKLTGGMPIYPEDYPHKKLKISRPIYQINNGASGAPYYGQEILPWSDHTQSFSVENAVCLFYINGDEIVMKVLNPDTLNKIDEVKLR